MLYHKNLYFVTIIVLVHCFNYLVWFPVILEEYEIDYGDFEELCSKKTKRAKRKAKRH